MFYCIFFLVMHCIDAIFHLFSVWFGLVREFEIGLGSGVGVQCSGVVKDRE